MHDEFQAIGTLWHIDIVHNDADMVSDICGRVKKRIEIFEQTYSRFRENSLIDQISKKEGVYLLPADATPMLDMYRKLYDMSTGSITPLIGQTLVDTGYDKTYSLTPKKDIRNIQAWDDVLLYRRESQTLTVYTPVQLDFGAIGKGYLIDIVRDMLEKADISMYTIDAGRDIYHKGKMLDIALENPFDTTQAIGMAHITQGSICGSAGNRRAWSTYTHIIDPKTNTSPKHIAAVWVVADTAMLADSLTTAIFFIPLDVLKIHFSFEHVIVYADGSAVISPHFPGELF